MNSQVNILNPRRERRIPSRFSWLDQRLVRENWLRGLSSDAVALYLFLNCVSDARGMSFYSDSGIIQRLAIKSPASARTELIAADLLAHEAPFYQLLSLEAPPSRRKSRMSRQELVQAFQDLSCGDKSND